VVATLPECVTPAVRAAANEAKLVVLQGLQESLSALDAAAWLGAHLPGELPAPVAMPNKTKLINESDAKNLLRQNGVSVPNGVKCNRQDVSASAQKIGFPVTLKGLGLAHKSESGAVRVGIKNQDELTLAFQSMPKDVADFLVEQTITDVVAEVLVSVRRDAPVGWLITLGAGGIYTELWRDTVSLLAPTTDAEIRTALASLRIAPLLNGYRGKPAGDLDALVALTQKVISLTLNEGLVEVELNPVLVTKTSAVAVDALMIAESK
jgi:acetyl-CoA synthetase